MLADVTYVLAAHRWAMRDAVLEDRVVMSEPSGDGRILAEQDVPLILPRPSDTLKCSPDPRYAAQMDSPLPNVPTPKRPSDPSDEPSDKASLASREANESTVETNL